MSFDSVRMSVCDPMKLSNRYTTGLAGLLLTKSIRRWMASLDYRVLHYDRSIDPINGPPHPGIYIFWHENILFPLYLRGRCHLSMLLSRHRDADILAEVARFSGFGTVRGSTGHGGREALEQLVQRSRTEHITITPDGPRGPRRRLAFGPIYLASRTGLPIIPLGFGYDRPWRVNSWDRFAIPRPMSRARAVTGPRVTIPRGLERNDIEPYRVAVERLLTELTDEAYAWAESGKRRVGEEDLPRTFAPPPQPMELAPSMAASRAA
ncbi:lysophospholipid acyltransferase family protein [Aeoliella sp.]|uniref:lysophospholipid acyltransferase family protein n=1 Tax=Aeoliella sp. TaxID=2795800 RepID=UPI003CCC0BD8